MSKEKLERAQSNWRSNLIEFGEDVLRPKRKELNLTQKQMAKKVGLHRSRISRFESGYEKPKDYSTAKAIAREYRLNPEESNRWFKLTFGITMPDHHAAFEEAITFFPKITIKQVPPTQLNRAACKPSKMIAVASKWLAIAVDETLPEQEKNQIVLDYLTDTIAAVRNKRAVIIDDVVMVLDYLNDTVIITEDSTNISKSRLERHMFPFFRKVVTRSDIKLPCFLD